MTVSMRCVCFASIACVVAAKSHGIHETVQILSAGAITPIVRRVARHYGDNRKPFLKEMEAGWITINITRLKLDYPPAASSHVVFDPDPTFDILDRITLSPPCKGICADVAKGGILFIGDSPVRRLYIRLLARIEGLTDGASEMLQNAAKESAHKVGNADLSKFRNEHGEPLFDYSKGGMRIRFAYDDHYNATAIAMEFKNAPVDTFRYVFYGFPTTHLLYYPVKKMAATMSCQYGRKFPAELSNRLEAIFGLSEKYQSGRVIFGNGPPFADRKPLACTPQPNLFQGCQDGFATCDWLQDNGGVKKANELYNHIFTKFAKPFMRLADTHNTVVTSGFKYCCGESTRVFSDGGVHYTYPILDLQLDTIFKTI